MLGLLVNGAAMVEEEVERLKRNLSTITSETRIKAGAGMKSTWRDVSNSFEGAKVRLGPAGRGVEPYQRKLSKGTKAFLGKAETRARIMVGRTIDRTIVELEKVRRRLGEDSRDRGWHAA